MDFILGLNSLRMELLTEGSNFVGVFLFFLASPVFENFWLSILTIFWVLLDYALQSILRALKSWIVPHLMKQPHADSTESQSHKVRTSTVGS